MQVNLSWKQVCAEDVRDVIHEVQEQVKDKFHVTLETEVIFLGWEKNR